MQDSQMKVANVPAVVGTVWREEKSENVSSVEQSEQVKDGEKLMIEVVACAVIV